MFDICIDELLEGFEVVEVAESEFELNYFVEFVEDVKSSLNALNSKIVDITANPEGGNLELWMKLTNLSQGSLNYTVSRDFDVEEFKFLLRNYMI